MMKNIQVRPFGAGVDLITLSDGPVSVELLSYGAAVRSIWVPDRDGKPTDVCLGYDTLEEYRQQDACFGGTIGRCANRIANAEFAIDDKVYHVTANEGANQLHGGVEGFHKKLWAYTCGENSVTFTLDSPDGDEGFPGNMGVEVTYTMEGGRLTIDYHAVTDRDTVVNLTNHAYFNLAGHDGGEIADHVLQIRAGHYTPSGAGNIPTGEIAPVDGTPLDLRVAAALGERLGDPFLQDSRGFDHNYVLESGEGAAAVLYCPRTGIAMEMRTTMEGMQLYSAGFLTERPGKDGVVYGKGHGLCLEPQHFPDAVNHKNFPTPILRAGAEFRETTVYRFYTA